MSFSQKTPRRIPDYDAMLIKVLLPVIFSNWVRLRYCCELLIVLGPHSRGQGLTQAHFIIQPPVILARNVTTGRLCIACMSERLWVVGSIPAPVCLFSSDPLGLKDSKVVFLPSEKLPLKSSWTFSAP